MLKRPISESSRVLAVCLDSEAGRSVLAKDLAGPDIAPQRRNGLVTRLTHDDELADAVHRRLGHASGAEGVPAELDRPSIRPSCSSLQELSNGVFVQAASRDMSIAADRPEDRAFSNPGPVEPLTQRSDRASLLTRPKGQAHFPSGALLVRLRLADVDDDTVGREFQIIYIDTGQFRSPEAARESDQHQSCVSKAEQVLAPGSDDPPDVCREKRSLSVLRGADGAADTLERLAHDKMAGRGGRVGEARGLVGFGDRSETAGDGARRQCGGAVGDVEGNGLRCRGERRQLMFAAPGLEVAPVISVCLECGGSLGCGNEGLRLLDQFLDAWQWWCK